MKPNLPHLIKILNPCHEDWSNMTPTEKGRHCASCEKIVVDFSRMHDQEIMAHIQMNGLGCGRFRADQLQRPLTEKLSKNHGWNWHWLAAAGLSAFLSLQSALASQRPKSNFHSSVIEINVNAVAHREFVEFEGVVMDYKKQLPIAEAEVHILATGETVKTGQDGTFRIKILMTDFLKNDSISIFKRGFYTKDYSLKLLEISNQIQLFKIGVKGSSYSFNPCEDASVCIDVELEISKEPLCGFEVQGVYYLSTGGVRHTSSSQSSPDFIARGLYAVLDLFGIKH